jgi:ketosteroid isomerase-like protein
MKLLPLAYALLTASIQSPTPPAVAPPPASSPVPSVSLPAELDRVLRDYEAAWTRGDAQGLAALFAEDGFVLPMGNSPVRGRDAIRTFYATSSGSPLSLRAIAFATEGSTGFILGCFSPQANGPDAGKFTLTLRKGPSGRWLIFSDMDNPSRRR